MHTEHHTLTFTRDMVRSLQERSMKNQSSALIEGIASKSLTTRGWDFQLAAEPFTTGELPAGSEDNYRYHMHFVIDFTHPSNKPSTTEFPGILFTLYSRAIAPAGGRWTLSEVDGQPYLPPEENGDVSSKITREMVGYADCVIPEDWSRYFDHLYGLDAQVYMARKSLEAAIASDWRNRFNVVLVGPPGCGKSDIGLSIKKALGEDAVMSLDATAVTAAGLQKEFRDRDILPRVVIFEEIEKAPESALQPLLAMLDQRGELRKVTARENVQRDTKILAIATVNNYERFEAMQAGALASRFSATVYFGRPGRDVLAKILLREIEKVSGSESWVKPTLDYCEERGIDDPRQVISICLCGGDDLVSGEFQKMMGATSKPINN